MEMSTADTAVALFESGYNCAQSVLAACGESRGLPRDTALRVAGSFGGGMGRLGESCGAVTGAMMVIGLAHAKTAPGEDAAREKGYELTRALASRFKEKHHTTCCRELIGCDLTTPEGRQQAKDSGVFKTVCVAAVRDAATIVEDLLADSARDDSVRHVVRDKYAAVAASSLTNNVAGVAAVAEAFGYSPEELASIPAEANMGLSCGNPVATAHLHPGEVVVDLGSGGGLDIFLAAQKIGPKGRAIGIDMTPEMIARANAAAQRDGYANVQFLLAAIDRIPLPDASVDVVISNCVINLAPDKPAVFREIFRILKPGGRVAVSDIALKQPLPQDLADSVAAYVGCIAGAIPLAAYESGLRAAGFANVAVIDTGKDLNAYAKLENQGGCCSPAMKEPAATSCCGGKKSVSLPTTSCCGGSAPAESSDLHTRMAELLRQHNVNDYAASCQIYALKA
jgi:arsenite methyltransferase